MEVGYLKLFDWEPNYEQLKRVATIFKSKKLSPEQQNAFIEKLFVDAAVKRGFNAAQIAKIRKIADSTEFDLSKSELLYTMISTTKLQKKIERAKEKINNILKQEAEKEENLDSKDVSKEQEDNLAQKLQNKKLKFSQNSKFLQKLCAMNSAERKDFIYNELKGQAIAQGFTQEELEHKIHYVTKGNGPFSKKEKIEPPRTILEQVTEEVEKSISQIAEMTNKQDVLNIIKDPKNQGNDEMKLMVMAHLKEATDQEFNDLINRPEMKSFLGVHLLQEVVKAKKADRELEDVSAKIDDKKVLPNNQKGYEPTEEERELAKAYGINLEEVKNSEEFWEIVADVNAMDFVLSRTPPNH